MQAEEQVSMLAEFWAQMASFQLT